MNRDQFKILAERYGLEVRTLDSTILIAHRGSTVGGMFPYLYLNPHPELEEVGWKVGCYFTSGLEKPFKDLEISWLVVDNRFVFSSENTFLLGEDRTADLKRYLQVE